MKSKIEITSNKEGKIPVTSDAHRIRVSETIAKIFGNESLAHTSGHRAITTITTDPLKNYADLKVWLSCAKYAEKQGYDLKQIDDVLVCGQRQEQYELKENA